MNRNLELSKEKLVNEGHKFVLTNGDEYITSSDIGVKPLLEQVRKNRKFKGYVAADTVVGKAAALLYTLLEVDGVYAKLISEKALKFFEDNGIYCEYLTKVPYIKNRTNTGMCPFEEAVTNVKEPHNGLIVIKETVRKLMGDKA